MQFQVRDLEAKPIPFDRTYQPGVLDFSAECIRQVGPLHAVGRAELANDMLGEIRVSGRLTGTLEANCDRCLEPVRLSLDEPFDLLYRPSGYEPSGEEHELAGDESEVGFYEGNGIGLEDVLHEQVMLSLPMQQVCGDGCRGICPECGQNRNSAECGCEAKPVDDRWSALRGLKTGTERN